jgi:alpha-glucosidase
MRHTAACSAACTMTRGRTSESTSDTARRRRRSLASASPVRQRRGKTTKMTTTTKGSLQTDRDEDADRVGKEGRKRSVSPPRSPLKRAVKHITRVVSKPRRALPRFVEVYAPRVPIVSSAFVFAAFTLLGPYLGRMYHAISPEGVILSDISTQSFELGKFIVRWDREAKRMSAVYKAQQRRWCLLRECAEYAEAWSTTPGEPFVRVANGPIDVHQLIAGHFAITMRRNLKTSIQTIDEIEHDVVGKKLTLRGKLVKDDALVDKMLSRLGDIGAYVRDTMVKRQAYKAQAKLAAAYEFSLECDGDDRLAFVIDWDDEVPGVLRAGMQKRRRIVGLNQLYFTYAMDPDERVYGLGEQFSSHNHRGRRVPVITGEQGIGRGLQPISWTFNSLFPGSAGKWHTTYTAIPHYVTHKARSVFLTNYTYSEFDFTHEHSVVIHAAAPTGLITGQIIGAVSIPDVLAAYTDYSGRMDPLPEWALDGVILGMTGGPTKVREVYGKMGEGGVKVAGLWLQDWGGVRNTSIGIERVWWNWRLDKSHYTDWHALRDEVRKNGTHLMTYVNTFLMDSNSDKGLFYRMAKEKNYMVRDVRGEAYRLGSEPGVTFGLLDLSNPECVQWIEDIIVDMIKETGASGWMADFGEYLPFDANLASGELPIEVHNRYPEDWAEVNRRALKKAGLEGKGFFWSRSASTKSPKHSPLFWLGDQMTSWDGHDGIKTAVLGLLSGGLSGLTLSHSDVGGYTATPVKHRSAELLMRWMELNAFSDAIYRTHQGNRPHHNAQPWHTPELIDQLKICVDIHLALKAYKMELMQEAQSAGLPLSRSLVIHYPYDSIATSLTTQFLIGRDILFAPVLDRGSSSVHVYLPPGEVWLDVWTTQQTPVQPDEASSEEGGRGKWITVDAPIGWPAAFIRKSAGKSAMSAVEKLHHLAMERGGVPAKRRVRAMDPVERIVMGSFM